MEPSTAPSAIVVTWPPLLGLSFEDASVSSKERQKAWRGRGLRASPKPCACKGRGWRARRVQDHGESKAEAMLKEMKCKWLTTTLLGNREGRISRTDWPPQSTGWYNWDCRVVETEPHISNNFKSKTSYILRITRSYTTTHQKGQVRHKSKHFFITNDILSTISTDDATKGILTWNASGG